MCRSVCVVAVVASLAAGCGRSVNVDQERSTLMNLDREWSQSAKDPNKFLSYFAPDASAYAPGEPVATGSAAIKNSFTKMTAMPGFSLSWTPAKADVSASGDMGYTAGTYQMTAGAMKDKGKYVTTWKKQASGEWKAVEDIFNSDMPAGN